MGMDGGSENQKKKKIKSNWWKWVVGVKIKRKNSELKCNRGIDEE